MYYESVCHEFDFMLGENNKQQIKILHFKINQSSTKFIYIINILIL